MPQPPGLWKGGSEGGGPMQAVWSNEKVTVLVRFISEEMNIHKTQATCIYLQFGEWASRQVIENVQSKKVPHYTQL